MLGRDLAEELLPRLALLGIEGRICVDDIQALVDAERRRPSLRSSWSQGQPFHAEYHTGEELLKHFMKDVVPAHAAIASTFSIGTTHEGRDLRVIRITGGAQAANGGVPLPNGLPAVWVQSLMHAREHLAGASLAYAVDEILTQYGVQPWATSLGKAPLYRFQKGPRISALPKGWNYRIRMARASKPRLAMRGR
jgi:hypothetical protein